jgi:hypothetical protein
MDAIERIEISVRAVLSNVIAPRHGAHWYMSKVPFGRSFDHARFVLGFAIPQPPVQTLNLRDDHRLRFGPRRVIARETAGDLLQVLQSHCNVEPCVDDPSGSRASKRISTGESIAVMCPALSMRHIGRWPRWGSRSGPKQSSDFESHWFQRVLRIVGRPPIVISISSFTPAPTRGSGRRRLGAAAFPRIIVAFASQAIRWLNHRRNRARVRSPDVAVSRYNSRTGHGSTP